MTSERKCSKAGCGAQEIIGKPCTDFDCPQQWVHHTRAVPDVPELVRYNFTRDYVKTSNGFRKRRIIKECVKGKYVLYTQAAEIIAAKDAEIERLRSLNHYAALEAQAIKRAEAAEAKNIELEAAWLNAEGKISDLEAKLTQYEALAEFEPANTEICLVCDGAGEIKLPDVDFYSPCPDCFKKD